MPISPATALLFGVITLASPAVPASTNPVQKAFPGAEGYGAYTQGGRGGRVIKVTHLGDAGPGSLRAAIEAKGPRIILFEVAGTIDLQSPLVIRNPNITLAGQSAPGGGITLKRHGLIISAGEVIIRFIRVRPGDISGAETDAISLTAGRNIIIDHCSASWSTDETLSVSQHLSPPERQLDRVTVQWSIIAQSLDQSVHTKGAHGYGSLVRGSAGSRYSFHHNLWAHHRARMPRPGNFADPTSDPVGPVIEFANNVFYNWGGGKESGSGYNVDEAAISRYDFRANSYRPGPNSQSAIAFVDSAPGAQAFVEANIMGGDVRPAREIFVLKRAEEGYFSPVPLATSGLKIDPALPAEAQVLAHAGASVWRDSLDQQIVADVRAGTGRIINSQNEVGNWPELPSGQAAPDRDGDGMPDLWEVAHGFDPDNAADASRDPDGNGYSALEDWLNSLAATF